MDNRQFNVNGASKDLLVQTLKLAFEQSGNKAANAYRVDPEKGLILLWNKAKDSIPFPAGLDAGSCADLAWVWLKTDEGKRIKITNPEDSDYDHDGDNELGWRVYCEMWGHVRGEHYSIVAIKPAYLWYGK